MGAKIKAFEIFQTPLSSHYPLPLMTAITDDYVPFYYFDVFSYEQGLTDQKQQRINNG